MIYDITTEHTTYNFSDQGFTTISKIHADGKNKTDLSAWICSKFIYEIRKKSSKVIILINL